MLGSLIGVAAGLGSIAFYYSIHEAAHFFLIDLADYHQPFAAGEGATVVGKVGRPWALPLVLTLGGLLSGLIVYTLAPAAEGHGTDVAIGAFHRTAGRIRARIPPVKLIASAITIGSGGSAGREGPTAEIAAGFGSWLGEALHLSDEDRRIAVAVGIGAGIGSIFKAPFGGAVLGAEILYIRDFELDALIPGFIASVIGYSIFASWAGWHPVFGLGSDLTFRHPHELVWYFVLGLLCGLAGMLYARTFYATRDLFRSIRIPNHVKPAIGGLGVGVVALFYPQVLGMGYGWLQIALDGNVSDLALKTMLILIVIKIVATALTVGSGGSGGVFAPGLFIGGMLGGSLWSLLHAHVPWMPDTSAAFVIVGMMALFGGVAKAPIAVILMVAEMTNEFSMVIPAMLATTVAYVVTGDVRIYENQVNRRSDSPAHRGENAISLLQLLTVADAMRKGVQTFRPDMSIAGRGEATRPVRRARLPRRGGGDTRRDVHDEGCANSRTSRPADRGRSDEPRSQSGATGREPRCRIAAYDGGRHLTAAGGEPRSPHRTAGRRQRPRHRDRAGEAPFEASAQERAQGGLRLMA